MSRTVGKEARAHRQAKFTDERSWCKFRRG